ncbi:DUF3302 domain-containing protein [Candidatus Berkiella aquae]|uniref:Inner membrane protein YiaW n=2 Tax=Candidatus Berkiella aquae TaxID=295108 RepID=A0A0Q9YWA4_9GAMM
MLDYFALILLIFVAIVIFYGIIAIHDIPYEIAKSRQHPQQDAIHVAGWISLFTLHVIWPFLWIWATLYRPDRGWGFVQESEEKADIEKLQALIIQMQTELKTMASEDKNHKASLSSLIETLRARIEAIEAKGNKEVP